MAVMQLLLLSLPQPHLQVNNHPPPRNTKILYCMHWHPIDCKGKSCKSYVSTCRCKSQGSSTWGLPEYNRIHEAGNSTVNKAGQLVSSQTKQIPVPHICSLTRWSHTLYAGHWPQKVTGSSKSLQFCGVKLVASSAVLKSFLEYAGQIKYNLILVNLARILQGGRNIRLERK